MKLNRALLDCPTLFGASSIGRDPNLRQMESIGQRTALPLGQGKIGPSAAPGGNGAAAGAGPKLQDALKDLGVSELIEIVPKPKGAKGFTVLSRGWVAERTPDQVRGRLFAWMGRCRRLAKDVERTVASSLAWAKLAGCRFMMRRVARHQRPRMSSEIAA